MTNLKRLLTLLIVGIICHNFLGCQSADHETVHFYSNIIVDERTINGKKLMVIDENLSWCSHRSYHFGLDYIGGSSEWTNVSLYNCFYNIGAPYEVYLDDNVYHEKIRVILNNNISD